MIDLSFRGFIACAFVSSLALTACSQKSADIPLKGEGSPYLFVFAGDQDKEDPDFLAMMNVDPTSETRGEPVSFSLYLSQRFDAASYGICCSASRRTHIYERTSSRLSLIHI